jgi:Ca2+-binding EF-hand superfamily protein
VLLLAAFVPAAFCTSDSRLLQAMYAAMDDSNRGWISFSQFACALSTLYRGDKDDILTFWFRMYDRDRDGFLDKQVRCCCCCFGTVI